MSIETAGVRFKNAERTMRMTIPRQSIVGMRLDGKSFHTFTRQFNRPFDETFMSAMDTSAAALLKNLPGAMFGYVQSDEISVFFSDMFGRSPDMEMPFGGRSEKLLSTSASLLTGTFLKTLPEVQGIPVFDARLFLLPTMDELQDYVDWRRLDARKNAISMAASTLFTSAQLHGVSTRERHAMLQGTQFEELPGTFFEGRLVTREEVQRTVVLDNGQTTEVISNRWTTNQATRSLTSSVVDRFRS